MSLVKADELSDVERIRRALSLLRQARDLLGAAGASASQRSARRTINSIEGALRHAENKRDRAKG